MRKIYIYNFEGVIPSKLTHACLVKDKRNNDIYVWDESEQASIRSLRQSCINEYERIQSLIDLEESGYDTIGSMEEALIYSKIELPEKDEDYQYNVVKLLNEHRLDLKCIARDIETSSVVYEHVEDGYYD